MDHATPPDQWRRIEALFTDALDLPPDERAAFLASACADDPPLYREVETLLRALDEADEFLIALDAEQAATLIDTVDEALDAGQRVGPYRLQRELGRGGMGVVYLAERADGQFEQQVALKVIKRGMDTDAILRRFLHERQILASLQHPNIARLLDGGMTEAGQPYFAMEYAEGKPLTDYCDRHRLSIQERLRLFQTVGEAVQYAHRNLVVHRDLKPSNILVTEEGQVKLLDFGIAKLLDDEAEGLTLQTGLGLRAMTPEYAAPEQVRGEPVTTATDVYSLGVVLYTLLTGHRPYQFERRTPDQVTQVVTETSPIQPSTAVQRSEILHHRDSTTEKITPEQVSQARATRPDRLRRRLQGDLDTIVLMALRKEPERRYATAEALVEDIRRHREGLPVQARKDTIRYRMAKFVRRHRTGVAAAALVLLALLGGLSAALWQAGVARQEAATAEAVTEFVVRLFEQADPDASPGQEVTARALLERSPEQIERELADQPKVQAEMLHVTGRLHMALGLYDEAEPLLQRALELRRTQSGARHPETAQTLALLGTLASAQSQYAEAETYLNEALELQKAAYGPNHLSVASTLNKLGVLSRRQGELTEAESLYRQVLAIRHRHLPPTHPDIAAAMTGLAYVLRQDGNYGAEPDSLYRQALAIRRQHYGDLHSATLDAMGAYSNFLQDKGDLERAEKLSRRELDLSRQLFGDEHPNVGHSYHTLARLMSIQGRAEAADSLYRQALRVYRAVYGNEHAYVGVTLSNLGAEQIELGRYDEAERLLREALDVYRQRYGPKHWYVAISTNALARLANVAGDARRAEALYREALSLLRTSRPSGHPITGMSLHELGALLLEQGRADEAEPLLREAEQSWSDAFDEEDRRLLDVRQDLGACLLALRRFEEAEALLLRIYPILKQKYGATSSEMAETRATLAKLYTAWGKPDQAAAYRDTAPPAPTPNG